MPWSHGHASDLPDVPKVRVNFASPEDLRLIPGVGSRLAKNILLLRESHGNLDVELLQALMGRPLRPEIKQTLDFSRNPELTVVERGRSGWYSSDEDSFEPDQVRLRLNQQIEKLEKTLGQGSGATWSVPGGQTSKSAGAIPAPLSAPIIMRPTARYPDHTASGLKSEYETGAQSILFKTGPKVTPKGADDKLGTTQKKVAISETPFVASYLQPNYRNGDISSGEEYTGTARVRKSNRSDRPAHSAYSQSPDVRRRLPLSEASSSEGQSHIARNKDRVRTHRRRKNIQHPDTDSDSDTSGSWSKRSKKKQDLGSDTSRSRSRTRSTRKFAKRHVRDSESDVSRSRSKRKQGKDLGSDTSRSRSRSRRSRKFKQKVVRDSESDVSRSRSKRRRHRKSALQSAPKLSFEGKGTEDWEVFRGKFQDYAEQMDWTPSECKACIKWCLKGKASKFCNSLLNTNEDLPYKSLMKKLEERFGDTDTRAAAQSLYNQATQTKDESLEDWADRVQELTAKAYKKLPEDYCRTQAVQKFCEGMVDSEAGHNVLMQEPQTLEQAVKRTRLFQHTKSACYKSTGHNRLPRVTAEDYDEVPEVCPVGEQLSMNAVIKEMTEQRKILEKLLLQDTPTYRKQRDPAVPKDYSTWVCHACHELGHIRRDCPKRLNRQDLNAAGTSQGANARTQEREGPNKSSK